jgi:ammonia channel protein AmtB
VIVAGMVGITAWLSAGLSEETWMALLFGLLSGIVMTFLASLLMNLCGLRTIVLVRLKCRFFEAGAR